MATDYLCGSCGAVLDNAGATCRNCGSRAASAAVPPLGATRFRRSRRSIRVATMLAIIPGLGHLYLGHTMKGLAYMVGAGGLEFIGLDLDATLILAPLGIPAGLGGAALWLHGIYDARRTAKQMEADGTL